MSHAIVLARLNGTYVRCVSGRIVLVHSEPCSCDVVLANVSGSYGPSSWVAQVRNLSPLILTFRIVELRGASFHTWDSPDFIVEDYEVGDGSVVQLSGRCRLSLLDDDDRFIVWSGGSGTVKSSPLDDVLAAIAAQVGLTVTGAPGRTVRDFNLAGNLLELFKDLVYPLEKFWMEGTQIRCSAAPIGSWTFTDQDDLLSCRFRRSRKINNQAVVERLESGGGVIELGSDEREGGALAGTSELIALSEPSRSFWVEWECARGVMLWSAYDGDGESLNPGLSALDNGRYQGSALATHVRFSYDLFPGANNGDVWQHRYKYTIWGWPAGAVEPPVGGYSKIGSAGSAPWRRFPEPFSLASIDTPEDAQAASNAIAAEGLAEGSSLSVRLKLTANVPRPFSTLNVTDYRTGFDGSAVAAATTISWDNKRGGRGGIEVESSVAE